jgi:hypothetical protein
VEMQCRNCGLHLNRESALEEDASPKV